MENTTGNISIIQKDISSLRHPQARYNGLNPGSVVLDKGSQKTPRSRPLQVDTIWERDIIVSLRDGIQLRADIFRPQNATEKIPILLVWTPYGKSGTGMFSMELVQARDGIPEEMLSGYECFEGPDPAEWNLHQYAVAHVDARGCFKSQGDHVWHGTTEGLDGYDTIEFLSQFEWSNGRVALIGNSWLATSQWFIAAERPPHLACILPLEGLSDVYRETLCRGGVPYLPFWTFLRDNGLYGENKQEDVIAMVERHPLMNKYWEDKRAKAHLIEVPAYVLATQSPLVNIPFSSWPPEKTVYERYYLADDDVLHQRNSSEIGSVSYQSDVPAMQMDNDSEEVMFKHTFTQKTTVVGSSKAILFMSCPDHDDLDIFVQLRKLDRNGKVLQNINIPLQDLGVKSDEVDDINVLKYLGPTGVLRASHRALDTHLSKPHWPMHDHANPRKITPGQVVRVEIGIWPAAIQFEAGEGISLKVSGHQMILAEFAPLRGLFKNGNKGRHVVHFGGDFASHILIPTVSF
ncbi:Alpha/Beta hydrolase protein [Penicillium malachiteum]|uniref:Alpha/Beta hydrolase protein n=1 Tax=Penicillium malachiteum TaxID=1324776 RepID=UPI002547F065|nr:Alpha/Beta hydrolase protein [Penicillium malachiteum]KAJ5714362.1 Alpha/Beta hydrolase protein [Penicillium malachiteum]